MNREYKIAEVKAKYDRDDIIEKITEYMKRDYENDTHRDLVNQIIYLNMNGGEAISGYTDSELITTLVVYIDNYDDWEDNDE